MRERGPVAPSVEMRTGRRGLTRTLKAPGEPGAVPSMPGSEADSAPSTGCFSLEHLREARERENKSEPETTKDAQMLFLMLNNYIDTRGVWSYK